jgi:hypothetical protein
MIGDLLADPERRRWLVFSRVDRIGETEAQESYLQAGRLDWIRRFQSANIQNRPSTRPLFRDLS